MCWRDGFWAVDGDRAREITKRYAREYAAASKKERGLMLDELVGATGWSRANARRQVRGRSPEGSAAGGAEAPRPRTYGYDTLQQLSRVWMLAGQPAGKYLTATMGLWLPKLEQHSEFDEIPTGSPITRASSC